MPKRAVQGDQMLPKSLTPEQLAQVEYAREELMAARATDLSSLDSASSVMQIERLRARLDDVLRLIDDALMR